MQSKTKTRGIGAVLSLLILLTGCSENAQQSIPASPVVTTNGQTESSAPVFNEESPPEKAPDLSMPSNQDNSTESPVNADSVGINDDVMWGIGKTVDEVTQKYGSATAGKNNVYTFENGYGKYFFSGGCKTIGEISARDFLVGDLSTVTLENFASKCGFEVVPLDDNNDPNTMYEGCKLAYYTHPSYDNVTFSMLYKESGFDETATFDVRYDS